MRIAGAALLIAGIALIGVGLLISGNPEPNISPILGRWFGFGEAVLIIPGFLIFISGIASLAWVSSAPSKA